KFVQTEAWPENERVRKEGSAAIADAAIASGVVRVVQESVSMIIPTGEKRGLAKNARPTVSRWPNRIWLQGPGANRFSAAGCAGRTGFVGRVGRVSCSVSVGSTNPVRGTARNFLQWRVAISQS